MKDEPGVEINQGAPLDTAVEATDSDAAQSIDYEEEYKRVAEQNVQALDALDQASQERDNYKRGMLKAKGKLDLDEGETPQVDIGKLVADAVQLEVSKMKGSLTKNIVQNTLSELSSNPSEQKLIQWHYENKLIKSGTTPEDVRNDLEAAQMLANRKTILKSQSELKVALKNKSQVAGVALGGGIVEPAAPNAYFSPAQIAEFKGKGWDDSKIQRLAVNMRALKQRTS